MLVLVLCCVKKFHYALVDVIISPIHRIGAF